MTRRPGPTATIERDDAPPGDAGDPHGPISKRPGFRLSLWGGLALLVLAGVALLAVLPTRAWLGQRRQLSARTTELVELQERNAKLSEQLDHLRSPQAVDEVAREKLGLVRPGEKAIAVLPAPVLTLQALPRQWPFPILVQLATVRG